MSTKLLVTGGTGYIASWIIYKLLKDNHEVHTTVRNKKDGEKIAFLEKLE
ncbi:MAG: SDR family oxidoreductase, partial [Bacteroidota bacterium]